MSPTTLAIIPARGGSKGIPRKNLKDLAGKPLLAWTIEQALATPGLDVYVSTEDAEIAAVSRTAGAGSLSAPTSWPRTPPRPSRSLSTPLTSSLSRATALTR